MEQIFISGVQKELQPERHAARDFIHGSALFRKYFHVFLFEDLPPADRRPDDVYLDEVKSSPIYVGIFGNEYGRQDKDGISATEKEFNHASSLHKRRYILIKGRDDKDREPKMAALIRRAGDELVRCRFDDIDRMLRLLDESLVQYLQERGFITIEDYDAAPCPKAKLSDISVRKLKWFIEKARAERNYALAVDAPPEKALAHLKLLTKDKPSRGAILLFNDTPERFVDSADLTCLQFHGTEIVKPIPSQQVYHGTIFELVDQAVDFVMARLTRAVEPSETSPEGKIRYEVPYRAIREAIVNAVAHRNYSSKSGVQVALFADRIEVWNPGGLPEDLTVDQLRVPHSSVPRNRLICEPLFLARYIERAGTGTLDMIRLCTEAGLPEPEFRSEGERFITVIWRDWLTETLIVKIGMNERQKKAIKLIKIQRRITIGEYMTVVKCPRRTAGHDLDELVAKGVLQRMGHGRGSHYALVKQCAKNVPNVP